MNNISKLIQLLTLTVLSLLLLGSCSKDKSTNPSGELPILTTATVSEVRQNTAQSGGTITSDGGTTVTARGVCWSTNPTPTVADYKTTDGAGVGSFTSSITGLIDSTAYYVRAYATNSSGTGYGSAVWLTTLHALIPALTTDSIRAVTQTTAECGGTITSDGGAAITARGVCWSTNPTPTVSDSKTIDGAGLGGFTSYITGLAFDTPYYVRAYAINSAGIGYGSIAYFSTIDSMGTLMDIDGNTYLTVKIDNQWWMAENLKVVHYRNGNGIPNVLDGTWGGLTTGAYCDYNNDTSQVANYGRLYNWYALDDSNNLAPEGWHMPDAIEWQAMVDHLGGNAIAGGKMKEAGTQFWRSPNAGATNESGFSAIPGGQRSGEGDYFEMGVFAYFWISTDIDFSNAGYRCLSCFTPIAYNGNYLKQLGFSVRCVKD